MSEPRVHTGLGAHDNLKDHIYIYGFEFQSFSWQRVS